MIKLLRFQLSLSLFLLVFAFAAFGQSNQNFNRARTYDVQHYIIRVQFDRQNKIVFGDTTVRLKPLNKNFKSVELDAEGLEFTSVRLESSAKELKYKTGDEKIIIELEKKYSPKDLISLRFKYSAKPKKGVYFVEPDIVNGEVKRAAQIWTQGEAEEAHHWFPSYDFPDDKATSEKFITVASDEIVIGNGELLETTQNADGTKTFHYKMPTRHSTYLTSFVVGKYVSVPDSYKNIPLNFYVYPGLEFIIPLAYGKTKNMMQFFEESTGIAYPYNKYDQTIVAHFQFGGMENVTATTMSDKDIMFANFASMRNVVEDLVSHELAHSWFGNLVTCRNWAELWLNEGFATFMEAAWREKAYGRMNYMNKMRDDADTFLAEDIKKKFKRGLYNQLANPEDSDSMFDTVSYQKAGVVVHMLRETVGEKAFWRALNVYLNRHKYENVETEDLKRVMENESKMNLDLFFAQWVYASGFPRLEVRQVYNRTTKMLTLTVNQTQKAEDSTPAAFYLPMDIEIKTASGTKADKIEIKNRNHHFTFNVDEEPERVFFDRSYKIPLKIVKFLPMEFED